MTKVMFFPLQRFLAFNLMFFGEQGFYICFHFL